MTEEAEVRLLNDQEMDAVAKELPLVKEWIKAVEAELLRRLEAGAEFKNVALVPKRQIRSWAEDKQDKILPALLTFLPLDQAAPRSVLSPAQAEKAVGKANYQKGLADLLSREAPGLTLGYR